MRMLKFIKRMFCRHEWQTCRKVSDSPFVCLSGEQLYRRCTKCGKVEKWIYREFEGGGYK